MQTNSRTSRIGHRLTLFAVIITVLLGVVSPIITTAADPAATGVCRCEGEAPDGLGSFQRVDDVSAGATLVTCKQFASAFALRYGGSQREKAFKSLQCWFNDTGGNRTNVDFNDPSMAQRAQLTTPVAPAPGPTAAQEGYGALATAVMKIIGWVVWIIVKILGEILALIISYLIDVAQYSNFINHPAITTAWKILRDIVNMFFILILVVIAFATVIGAERYQWRELLPRLFIMAVLVNFSKMIAGLLIDGSQVIMLTFVAGWADIGSGNFTQALGIDALYKINFNDDKIKQAGIEPWQVISGLLLALLLSIISVLTIGVMLLMLIGRVIMLWMLVVLSPAAYFCSTFPQGEEYHKKWWSTFINYLIVGPALAFFIWFGFLVLQSGQSSDSLTNNLTQGLSTSGPAATRSNEAANNLLGQLIKSDPNAAAMNVGGTTAGTKEHLLLYIIAIGLFLGGATMAGELGTAGGAMMVSVAEGIPEKLHEFAKEGVGAAAGYVHERAADHTGYSFNPMDYWRAFEEEREKTKRRRLQAGKGKAEELFENGVGNTILNSAGRFVKRRYRGWTGKEAGYNEAEENVEKVKKNLHEAQLEVNMTLEKQKFLEDYKDLMEQLKTKRQERLTAPSTMSVDDRTKLDEEITTLTSQVNERAKEVRDKGILNTGEVVDNAISRYKSVAAKQNKAITTDEVVDVDGKQVPVGKAKLLESAISEFAILKKERDKSMAYVPVFSGRYESIAARKEKAEEAKKVADMQQSSELINFIRDILEHPAHLNNTSEMARFSAVMEKLGQNGDFNELLHDQGFASGYQGMRNFFDHIIEDGGLSEKKQQDLFKAINDVSFVMEGKNHFDMARMVDLGHDGKWKWLSEDDHARAASTEILKGDPERTVRNLSRLGLGGELQDESGTRHFMLGKLGYILLSQLGNSLHRELIQGKRIPMHAMGRLQSVMDELEVGVKNGIFKADAGDWVAELKKKKFDNPNDVFYKILAQLELMNRNG